MKIFEGNNPNNLYKPMLKYLLDNGNAISPRGLGTKEITAVTIIKKPQQRLLSCYKRFINPFFLVAEALWILAGRGDTAFIINYNKALGLYADEGFNNFNGAYGVRLRKYGLNRNTESILNFDDFVFDQLADVIDKLKKDNSTRQAVATLHNPIMDNANIITNDRPCNIASIFKIRAGKLNLHQVLRSNDINLGLFPTNVFQWSIIQEYVASSLGLHVGELMFFSDSLHVYDNDEITSRVLASNKIIDIYKYIKPLSMPVNDLQTNDLLISNILAEKNILLYPEYWYNFYLMLKIYQLRKEKMYLKAIELTNKLTADDFKILALNYHYNKSKNEKELSNIRMMAYNYHTKIQDFIMEKNDMS